MSKITVHQSLADDLRGVKPDEDAKIRAIMKKEGVPFGHLNYECFRAGYLAAKGEKKGEPIEFTHTLGFSTRSPMINPWEKTFRWRNYKLISKIDNKCIVAAWDNGAEENPIILIGKWNDGFVEESE